MSQQGKRMVFLSVVALSGYLMVNAIAAEKYDIRWGTSQMGEPGPSWVMPCLKMS